MIRPPTVAFCASILTSVLMAASFCAIELRHTHQRARNLRDVLTSSRAECSLSVSTPGFFPASLSSRPFLLQAAQISAAGVNADASVGASAENAPIPPTGWEMPAAVNQAKPKKTATPECCGFDKLCCSRQSEIDLGIPRRARSTFDVPFSKIPETKVQVAAKDGPPIEGIADLHVVDGAGRPFPWPDEPQRFEVRVILDAAYGYLKFGDSWGAHYGNPKLRSLGYGVIVAIGPTPDHGRSLVKGPVEYWTYNPGKTDEVLYDHVIGKLDGSPKVLATRWEHAEAPNVADGVVHAYRSIYNDKPHVVFLLPEVATGFESKDATTFGGTGRDRFATDFPYTLYRFPLSSAHSNTANCILREYEVRRWFPRPKDAVKLPEDMPIVISMSQTSAEPEPRIRIMFL